LVLDPYPKTSSEFYHQCPGICVTHIGDQGLEVVQVVVHRLASLVIGDAFQSIDGVHFRINREEVDPELLLKVSSGLDREDASVHFLAKHVFGLLGGTTTFEECESPEDLLLLIVELLRGWTDVQGAEVQEHTAVVMFSAEVQGKGEFGTHSSRSLSGGWEHRRRWYRRRRHV